jgi:hypothetical protein
MHRRALDPRYAVRTIYDSLSAALDRKNQITVDADGAEGGADGPYDVTEVVDAQLHRLCVDSKRLDDGRSQPVRATGLTASTPNSP